MVAKKKSSHSSSGEKEAEKKKQGSVASAKAKDAVGDGDGQKEEEKDNTKDADTLTLEDIREQVRHIEKAVVTKEPRFTNRVLRTIPGLRRRLNCNVLRRLILAYYTAPAPAPQAHKQFLLSFLDEPMETDSAPAAPPPTGGKSKQQPLLPEVDVYLTLLVVIYLLDNNQQKQALKCSSVLMERLGDRQNRRTLDLLAAKAYFYHARLYELEDQPCNIRTFLHARLRTATLHGDLDGQAVLVNLLLRNYIHHNLYDQAHKLVAKSTFPPHATNNEWARYLYYLGRIRAIHLEYTESYKNLMQAIRKAPQNTALGFKQTAYKFAIVVELLLGEIPERQIFRTSEYSHSLYPYFQLTQAVLAGSLKRFNEVLENFGPRFKAEQTWTLIVRLRHNVIKAGVRQINLSYSKISLVDVARKLGVDSPEDAEFIVSKAIRDGVIEASVSHSGGYMASHDIQDIYATAEPQLAFHQRISFCLDTRNQSVKAMRFPAKSYNADVESAEERREREQGELELAKELADDDDEF